MLEKVIAILSEIVASNTAITSYKEKPLPLDTRNYSISVKRKQRTKKKFTMISDKLFFPFLVERNTFVSNTTMDEHRSQALADLQKSPYTTELIT